MIEQHVKKKYIELLADQMISLGYVASDFKEEVWKRENASSTAFMNIRNSTSYENECL